MIFDVEERRPTVVNGRNLGFALAIHAAFFLALYLFAVFHGLFDKKETVIPIDLTVVVNENLDGEENEPPPLNDDKPPEPEPEPPKPKVEAPPEPKVEHVEAVERVQEKPKKEEKKAEKPKEPEKPKKTKEQLLKERLENMRKDAKFVKKKVTTVVKDVPSGNGRTDRKTLNDPNQIRDFLNKGYKPGTTTQLAASEMQLCLSLIKQAFYDKWDRPPWTDTLRSMVVRVWFGAGGRIINYKLESGSGDARADATIMRAARLVGSVPGLTPDFLSQYRKSGIPVRFTVTPQ